MKYWLNQIKPFFVIFIATLFGLQLFFYSQSYAQNFTLNNNLKKDNISFLKVKNLIVIKIYINNTGPYNFILDTGVDPLIITEPKLADSLKITSLRSVKINGIGEGDEISALFSTDVNVNIGESAISNIPTVFLKEDLFNLSNYLGLKIHGLIGYYFFNSFIVKINYYTNRIVFRTPESGKHIKGAKLDLEFLNNKPYINTLLSTASLGEISAKLIVDCGASHAISLETYKEKEFPLPSPNINGNLGVGLSGEINGKIGRITSLKLGPYQFKNIIANFPDYSNAGAKTKQKERTGNLGADILSRFHVTFDYQGKAMYIKKNDAFRLPFEHDMAGMEIFMQSGSPNRIFIGRIEEESAAEKAGFLLNDEIMAINFKTITSYSLDEIVSLLKGGNGNTVVIEIARKNKTMIKLLSLKRRV